MVSTLISLKRIETMLKKVITSDGNFFRMGRKYMVNLKGKKEPYFLLKRFLNIIDGVNHESSHFGPN